MGPPLCNPCLGKLQNCYADLKSSTTLEKLDNGEKRRIWTQMSLVILSPPLAHATLQTTLHNINSVGKEIKEYVSCGQSNWLAPFFTFPSTAFLSDTASVQSFSRGWREGSISTIHAFVSVSSSN